MGSTLDRLFVAVVLGGLAAWVVWGWTSWARHRSEARSVGAVCSLVGFIFACLSAGLEIGTVLYAQAIGGFPFNDPTLLKIYGLGLIAALLGVVCGLCGVGSKGPLRWKTLALSTFLSLLWFWHAMSE